MTLSHRPLVLPFTAEELAGWLAHYDEHARRLLIAVLTVEAAQLTPAQQQVIDALLDAPDYARAPTYAEVADQLGVHVGTVYQTLRRLRRARPNLHKHVTAVRLCQLAERHRGALDQERAARKAARWPERHQGYRAWRTGLGPAPWARPPRRA